MGLNHRVFQTTAVKDGAIRVIVLLIGNIEASGINVKGIRILHDELAHAQQPRSGARLVAELGLNLVPGLRQLPVAAQLVARNIGHDFFVGHAQTEIGALAVFEAKHVVAHDRPASAGFPYFTRIERRQIKFLPDFVHFLADDVRDLQNRALAKKQIGVNARCELADVSGTQQVFVACDLGVGRGLAQSRDKQL